MVNPLESRLEQGIVLADGAFGTMLYAAGEPLETCFDELNLVRPELVSNVHRAYIAAGSDLIETNTFGANRARLEQFHLGDKVKVINKRAVKLAREEREISGKQVLIAGSLGPTMRTIAPLGTTPTAEVRSIYAEQIEALLEGGVDLLVFETIGNLDEMVAAIEAAKAACDLPIVAMMTFAEDARTMAGHSPTEVVDTLTALGVTAVGANCSVGPQRILPVVRSMRRRLEAGRLNASPALACMPNAGWPSHVGGRVIYPSSPDYFASFATEAADAGVRIIGGCCGTTPEHIAAMRAAIDTWAGATASEVTTVTIPGPTRSVPRNGFEPASTVSAAEGPTELAQKLGKKFIVSVEIDPPKGLNPAKAIEGARLLQAAGVDTINVADSPMARVRMSALTLCYLIQHEVGIETILHFTTRDRSLMGLQSDLLGAHAAGVRNILALTGDPPSLGDYPESSAVYDIDSIGLIRVLGKLNDGTDSAGASIGRQASFTIACAIDPTRADLHEEARRLKSKLAAGANLVMTQPVYDIAVWLRFLEIYDDEISVPVMLGILPLQSSKHAEFLHNEVPGISLTDEARDRMRRAGAEGRREGVRMAQELLQVARPHVQGVYIMPSFGRYEVAAEVLDVLSVSV